jgi:hypothetical protein
MHLQYWDEKGNVSISVKEIENNQNVQCYVHFRVTEQSDGINKLDKNFETV